MPEAVSSGIQMPKPDPVILSKRDEIVAALKAIVPGEGVVDDPTEMKPFETDGFLAYRFMPLAVVLPETTEKVSEVLKYLSKEGVPVIPRGAGTSLAGGAIPQEDAVIVASLG